MEDKRTDEQKEQGKKLMFVLRELTKKVSEIKSFTKKKAKISLSSLDSFKTRGRGKKGSPNAEMEEAKLPKRLQGYLNKKDYSSEDLELLRKRKKNINRIDTFVSFMDGKVLKFANNLFLPEYKGTGKTLLNFIAPPELLKRLKDSKLTNRKFIDKLINEGSHDMPDGTVMSGETHSKNSIPLKEDEVRPGSTPNSSKEDEVRPSSGTTKAAVMEKTKFRNDVEILADFVSRYKMFNAISKPINLGSKLRKIIIDYKPESGAEFSGSDEQKLLLKIVRRLMDGLIPDDSGSSQFSRTLPESLKRRLKKNNMSPLDFVNFLINGGKRKDLKKPKKKDEIRPATKPASTKEDEVRPATKPISTKEDEVRPSSGTTKAKKEKKKKKYDRPPAYCFTRERLRDTEKGEKGQKYVVCVPSFV